MNEQMLDISAIRIDGDTQPRLAIDQAVIGEYAEAMEAGAQFPPVRVVSDGAANWLVDGFHRFYAHRSLGRKQIRAEVTTGLLAEAQWLCLAANRTHGLRRTNQDKGKAVIRALKMRPDLSDRAIAEHVGVDHSTVAKYRQSMENARTFREGREGKAMAAQPSAGEIRHLTARTGRDGKKYPARASGQPSPAPQALVPIRDHSAVDDRRHVGLSRDPAMGARALFELFDRSYVEQLVAELRSLLDGTAGPPPTLSHIPQALQH